MNEYSHVGANSSAGNYSTLKNMNTNMPGMVAGPLPASQIPKMNVETVPHYNLPLGVDALTHNVSPGNMGNGHFTIGNAYPAFSQKCDSFQSRDCAGYVIRPIPINTVTPRPTMRPVHPTMIPVHPTMIPVHPTMRPVNPTMIPVHPTMIPVHPTMIPVNRQ